MLSWFTIRTLARRRDAFPKATEEISASDPATVYNVIAAQMQQHDLLMWQVPVLSLTAQAFLFTIILGGDSARTARILAAVLAIISSVLSMQLMAKHHWYRQLEWRWLGDFEEKHHLEHAHGHVPKGKQPALSRLVHQSSYNLWQVGLGLFGVVSTFCLVLAVIKPRLL